MIGKNLKYFRLSAGLSQDELAKRLGITKMAISNYENDKREVDSRMLIKIADALNIKAINLLKNADYPLCIAYGKFRKKANISEVKKELVLETINRKLGNINEIVNILGGDVLPIVDISKKTKFENVESAAKQIRTFLSITELGPVGNITDVIENKGIIICELENIDDWFSGINGTVNERPFIVINKKMPPERQRFTLIHELVHILFDFENNKDEEKLVDQISGNFFFPKEDVLRELGTHRTDIRFDLRYLQCEYGISMQSVLLRAKQVGVITEKTYLSHQKWLSKLGLRKDEKSGLPNENSNLFYKLINRGVQEGIINENKASELLGIPYSQYITQEVL